MPVGSHYFSWWYWYSIIMYAYRHYFSGAINMCCDLGALDLTHTHVYYGWSMFQKCHLCIFPNQFGVTPILDSPTKDKEKKTTTHWLFFAWYKLKLFDWKLAAMEGQSFVLSLFGEVWGCHWKHAIFYIFAPCHQIRMRCSDHCSLCSCFCFFKFNKR